MMRRLGMVTAIALLGLSTFVPAASAGGRGVVIVRPYYFHAYPFWGYGYGPYSPWWGPWGGYYAYPTTGEVKLETKASGYRVYVDNGYIGQIEHNKKFRLAPGNHTIAIQDRDHRDVYQERVYVIAGKTLKIHPGIG